MGVAIRLLRKLILVLLIMPVSGYPHARVAGVEEVVSQSQSVAILNDILIEAESANTQIATIKTLSKNDICAELTRVHNNIHGLHNKLDKLMLDQSLVSEAGFLAGLENINSVLVSVATHVADLSMNAVAVKCVGELLDYNEGMSTLVACDKNMTSVLGLSNDTGFIAHHFKELLDKFMLDPELDNNKRIEYQKKQQKLFHELKLIQSLVLFSQRNSLSEISLVDRNQYINTIYSQVFSGRVLSAESAHAFLTRFNLDREWEVMLASVEGLIQRVDSSYEKIIKDKSSVKRTVNKDSYIAMTEMSDMVRQVAIAVAKMAETTERLSFSAQDDVLGVSTERMLELSSRIIHMAERVNEISGVMMDSKNKAGLSREQLIAAREMQKLNYADALASAEATQAIVKTIVKIHSL